MLPQPHQLAGVQNNGHNYRGVIQRAARVQRANLLAGKVRKVPEERQRVSNSSTNFLRDDELSVVPKVADELTARIYILEDVLKSRPSDAGYFDLDSIHPRAYVSDSLRISLQMRAGSRMIVRLIEESKRSKPTSLDIFTYAEDTSTVEDFKSYARLHSTNQLLLLNSRSILLDQGRRYVVQMSPADCDYTFLDNRDIESLDVRVRRALYSANAEILEAHCSEDLKLANISTR